MTKVHIKGERDTRDAQVHRGKAMSTHSKKAAIQKPKDSGESKSINTES